MSTPDFSTAENKQELAQEVSCLKAMITLMLQAMGQADAGRVIIKMEKQISQMEDEMVMPPEMKFSRRELEILKWTAEGKTSAEVAMILSISENTVNFHQKNMQRKFNAPNKTQIACYAVATGLI